MITLHACLATSLVAVPCYAPPALPPLPAWATDAWIHDAAGIVAGETVPNCAECNLWIACAVVEDVTLRGYHPWRLRPTEKDKPGRWHGWREPSERHLGAIEDALGRGCGAIPECAYLGSFSDYTLHWRYGLASERRALIIGNRHGAMACILSGVSH